MRILHVITDMRLGGAETALSRLALFARDNGHDVHVVALKQLGQAAEVLLQKGISCVGLRAPDSPSLKLTGALLRLRREIRRVNPDVIHAWLATGCGAVHLVAPREIPRVYNARVTDVPPRAVRALLRSQSSARHQWVAVSQGVARSWARALHMDKPMPVIPNGVTEAAYSEPPQDARPVFLGRLSQQKGVDVALRALVGTSLRLRVFGAGPQAPELRRLSAELGVDDQVVFMGTTTEPERVLRDASMVILPSRSEGMPNVALEAMVQGRAVIASRIPGTDEVVVDGETGILVAAEDPVALREAMVALERDPETRERMGRAGHARVMRLFRFEHVAGQWMQLYQQLLRL